MLATPGLDSIYAGADSASARILLALTYRAGAPAPAPAAMTQLLASDNPRVRTLAVRVLARGDAASRAHAARARRHRLRLFRARGRHTRTARGLASTRDATTLGCTIPDSMRDAIARARRVAQSESPTGTTFRGMASQPFRGWPYGVYVPDDYLGDEPFPLIIYLAGNSGPAIEGVQLASTAFERTGYLVVYPNAWGGWWRTNTETMVDSLMKEVMRKYNVDPARVYLSGLSNGGTGTFDYASLWPQRWSAAVVAMGAGLFGFIEPGGDRPFVSNMTHVPMLFLHGKRDQVIAVSATTRTVDSLRAQHADVAMTLFPQREHEIVPGSGDDGATVDFFQHHVSRSIPKKIDFMAATTAHARNYWIEILEKEAPAGAALKDDASIPDDVRARLGSLVRAEVRGSIDDKNDGEARRRARDQAAPAPAPRPLHRRLEHHGEAERQDSLRGATPLRLRALRQHTRGLRRPLARVLGRTDSRRASVSSTAPGASKPHPPEYVGQGWGSAGPTLEESP